MSMHYFSWSGGTGTDLTKSTLWQTRHTKLVFSASGGICGSHMLSEAFGARNVDALFFMLRWAWCVFPKKACRDTLC
jgi:hypothetical protein